VASVVIGLGSNLGDRLAHMQAAVDVLFESICICKASRVYETAPMYVLDQPSFYNAALLGKADLAPMELLALLKAAETRVGRKPTERYGPREIDIDLLVYGCLSYRFADQNDRVLLEAPHPRTPERRFVLMPLTDLATHTVLPGLPPINEMLIATSGQADDVRIVDHAELSLHGN
jgi:2-amino-4-hydroxy-6-hydroxymethyldihydropteridine diphosphokinase